MIVYSILIILSLLFHYLGKEKKIKNTKYIFWGLIIFLFLVSAFRYNVGQDYQHFVDVYHWIEEGLPGGNYVEIGYKAINYFIQILPFSNVYLLFIITSAIINFGFGYVIYKNVEKKYWFLAIFIFMGSGIFFASLNLIRQYIAIIITTFAVTYILQKKYIVSILLVLLASSFHTSALIMVPFLLFYLIFKNQKYEKVLLILYVLSLIIMVVDLRQIMDLFLFIIPERWEWYLQSEFLTSRNYSAIIKQLVPNILLLYALWKRKEILERNRNYDIYILMLFANVFITNCFYGVLVLLRLSYFFDISLVFVIPIIFESLNQYNSHIQILGKTAIIGYYILLTIVTIFIMNGHGVMPYQSILFV